MKKLIAVLVFLCILSVSAAFSEGSSVVSESALLKLDGFSLNLTPGSSYDLYEKKEKNIYITVFPQDVPDSNYDVIPFGGKIEDYHNTVIQQIKEAGYSIYGFKTDDIVTTEIAGQSCSIQNIEAIFYPGDQGPELLYQAYVRLIYFKDKGYLFVANGSYLNDTEAIMIGLEDQLKWD